MNERLQLLHLIESDDEEVLEDPNIDGDTLKKKLSSMSSSDIEKYINDEVDRRTKNKQENSTHGTKGKDTEEGEKLEKKKELDRKKGTEKDPRREDKKPLLKPSRTKRSKTTSPKKKRGSKVVFNRSEEELLPINIVRKNLFPFESSSVRDLLKNYGNGVIFSVCNKNDNLMRSVMNRLMTDTLFLQGDIIKEGYHYLPIYVVDNNKIVDIMFLVLNDGTDRSSLKFNYFIKYISQRYSINYIDLRNGKFSLVNQKKRYPIETNLYSRVLYYYSGLRGIKGSSYRKLMVNPPPISEVEKRYRCQSRFELCIQPKEGIFL